MEKKKATITQRFVAYLLDIIFVSIIASIVVSVGFKSTEYDKLLTEEQNLMTNYTEGEIDLKTYTEEAKRLTYEIDKIAFNQNLISLVITVGYFVVFQYLNKGQTIGKKIMHIRIKKQEDSQLKPQDIIIRAIIVNSILTTIVYLISILVTNAETYFNIKAVVSLVEMVIVFVSAFMILYRKDKLGIQDIITKTEVVKEG